MVRTSTRALLSIAILIAWFGLACLAATHHCPDEGDHADLGSCQFFGHCFQVSLGPAALSASKAVLSADLRSPAAIPQEDEALPAASPGLFVQLERAPPQMPSSH